MSPGEGIQIVCPLCEDRAAGSGGPKESRSIGHEMEKLTELSRIKWERSRDLKRRGAYQEAELELTEALEEQPDHPLLKVSLADLCQRQGKQKEARVLAESVLTVDPEYPGAYYVLGKVFFAEGDLEEALQYFQRASRRDGGLYLTRQIVRTLRKMGRYREALETVQGVLVEKGEDPSLLKEKALVLNRMGRLREALRTYERLHELAPKDLFVRSEVYRLKGSDRSPEEVIRELQAVLNLPSRKGDAQLHGLLGRKLREVGRFEEAAAEFHEAWRLSNGNPFFLKQEGFCRYRLGNYEEAMRALSRAFRLDPGDYRVRVTLEKICAKTENLQAYVNLLEEILMEDPGRVKLMGPLKRIKKRLHQQESIESP